MGVLSVSEKSVQTAGVCMHFFPQELFNGGVFGADGGGARRRRKCFQPRIET